MLSFKETKKGRPVAIINNGDNDVKNKIVYLVTDTDEIQELKNKMEMFNNPISYLGEDFFRKTKGKKLDYEEVAELLVSLKNKNAPRNKILKDKYYAGEKELSDRSGKEIIITSGSFQYIPNTEKRDVIYISAPSGSGKSYWCNQYIEKYRQIFKDSEIFLFSKVERDDSINYGNVKKIILNSSVVKDPIKTDELDNSLCIFDDVDTIRDKKVNLAIDSLKSDILETGRHDNIYLLTTSHQLNNGVKTRTVINESNGVVFFLNTGSTYYITYFLKNYLGLSKDQIHKLFSLKSRWCMVYTHAPRFVLSETEIFLL